MRPRQTALGRLLQERREAAGFSRTRIGELVGIKAGTIEGWELGRVARPPIHDVLRLAHFLRIPADEIQRAVFEDAGEAPAVEDAADEEERKKVRRRRSPGGRAATRGGFPAPRLETRQPPRKRSARRRNRYELGGPAPSRWRSPTT